MNPTISNSLPLRFRIEAVDRYGHIMALVSANWPQPISVDPEPLSGETFRCRFRDAVRAVAMHKEGATMELNKSIQPWVSDYSVAQVDGKIVIGPSALLRQKKAKRLKPGLLLSGIATRADQSSIVGPDKDVIQAIALLTTYGILSDARITGVTEEFIWACLPEDYEGGVVKNADETFSIY